MMDWYDGDVGWAGWFAMTAMMLVFWGLLVVAVIAVASRVGRDQAGRPGHQDPGQILDERFARGEIDADEYQARREALRHGTSDSS